MFFNEYVRYQFISMISSVRGPFSVVRPSVLVETMKHARCH
jgi:hypothetical protein